MEQVEELQLRVGGLQKVQKSTDVPATVVKSETGRGDMSWVKNVFLTHCPPGMLHRPKLGGSSWQGTAGRFGWGCHPKGRAR